MKRPLILSARVHSPRTETQAAGTGGSQPTGSLRQRVLSAQLLQSCGLVRTASRAALAPAPRPFSRVPDIRPRCDPLGHVFRPRSRSKPAIPTKRPAANAPATKESPPPEPSRAVTSSMPRAWCCSSDELKASGTPSRASRRSLQNSRASPAVRNRISVILPKATANPGNASNIRQSPAAKPTPGICSPSPLVASASQSCHSQTL